MSNTVYTALVEPYATEIFARRKAMDNPSSNAHTVIGVLPMKFNRTRQSKINNDLIITGANALP
ncbi:ATP synthase F1, gamma subunit [Puccinia striiformis f. sp. tritici PST-78]|uniref:ATP synthase F1, gamma subunit n=1 Tax=Puccinia striiformis f. sp. tritici PST-78 TaxID=1165861 RepID=A0A0L0VIN4_9BASI|nr:ATP synthase F1, gamma subunit [Puccinia striiformis f. sp. tritici PST-78]